MKFGKRILAIAAANPEYQSYYLDYKSLKKLLKNVSEVCKDDGPQQLPVHWPADIAEDDAEKLDAEEAFMLALEGEFAKVESLFRRSSAEHRAVFRTLCKRFAELHLSAPLIQGHVKSLDDLGDQLENHPRERALLDELLTFARVVDSLRGFVMTNAQALIKICKKHDKVSPIKIKRHFTSVLGRCTFYNAREFGGLIADVVALSFEVYTRFTGKPAVEDRFDCQICSHVLCNPLELSCGHRFCNSCVDLGAGFLSLHQCPVCSDACTLAEAHMRVHTLASHFERLFRASSFLSRSTSCSRVGHTPLEKAPPTMRRIVSEPIVFSPFVPPPESEAHGVSQPRAEKASGLPRNLSDTTLDSAHEVKDEEDHSNTKRCSLVFPCQQCAQRSVHVQVLRQLSSPDRASTKRSDGTQINRSPTRRHLLESIIKENAEQSAVDLLEEISRGIAPPAHSVDLRTRGCGETDKTPGKLSPLELPEPSVQSQDLSKHMLSEITPWSPSKRWTACADIFSDGQHELQRTSSFSMRSVQQVSALGQEMWRKIYAMEEQHQRDRSVRHRLWLLELLALVVTILICLRVGSPDLVCPGLDDGEDIESLIGVSSVWYTMVCGSWWGWLTPAGPQELQDVSKLQEARTRSLHLTLDKMVRRSMNK
jgi:hypothetical protein